MKKLIFLMILILPLCGSLRSQQIIGSTIQGDNVYNYQFFNNSSLTATKGFFVNTPYDYVWSVSVQGSASVSGITSASYFAVESFNGNTWTIYSTSDTIHTHGSFTHTFEGQYWASPMIRFIFHLQAGDTQVVSGWCTFKRKVK